MTCAYCKNTTVCVICGKGVTEAAFHPSPTNAAKAGDKLDMAYINSLPQPFMGRTLGGWWWPINDFEVQTGLIRIDVCGKLEVKEIGDFTAFRDGAGVERGAEAFYVDANEEERAAVTPGVPCPQAPNKPVAMVIVRKDAEDEFFWQDAGVLLELPPGEYDLYLAPVGVPPSHGGQP
jgi:hypothetical protein